MHNEHQIPQRRDLRIVSVWPRDFPGVDVSAQRLTARITALSGGKIVTHYFAAGEQVGAFESLDAVASGNAEAYIGADYYWVDKHPSRLGLFRCCSIWND